MIVSPVLESRLPVGSSAKMMSGSFVRARVVRGAFGHVAGVVQQQCVIRVRKIRFDAQRFRAAIVLVKARVRWHFGGARQSRE
jgi:hypothetical protein